MIMYLNIFISAILKWFVDNDIAQTAMDSGVLIEEKSVETIPDKVTAACVDKKVCLYQCKKYFTGDAWLAVESVVSAIKSNPVYHCGSCNFNIDDASDNSIQCDSCLTWFHFECLNITRAPKNKVWFCCVCH